MEGQVSLSIAIFIFIAILETSAQNFYPVRYGRRDEQAAWEKKVLANAGYNKRPDLIKSDSGNDLFYGTRYGKRSTNAAESVSPEEPAKSGMNDQFGKSQHTKISPRSNRFYLGPWFGKPSDRELILAQKNYQFDDKNDKGKGIEDVSKNYGYDLCHFFGFRHLYRCLRVSEGNGIQNMIF